MSNTQHELQKILEKHQNRFAPVPASANPKVETESAAPMPEAEAEAEAEKKPQAAANANGRFFTLDKDDAFLSLEKAGPNTFAAYAVLSCGTGRDHKTTAWSANAIREYTGLPFSQAKQCIEGLKELGLVSQTKGGTKPMYQLTAEREAPKLWLPNTFISEKKGENEDRPLRRLLRSGNARIVKLLLTLYESHELIDYSGVSPYLLRNGTYKLKKWGESGDFAVWKSETEAAQLMGENILKLYEDDQEAVREDIRTLRQQRILEPVFGVYNRPIGTKADTEDGLLEFTFRFEGGGAENKLGDTLTDLAFALMEQMEIRGFKKAQPEGDFVALPTEYATPTLIEFFRLRYHPRTAYTTEWIQKGIPRLTAIRGRAEAALQRAKADISEERASEKRAANGRG